MASDFFFAIEAMHMPDSVAIPHAQSMVSNVTRLFLGNVVVAVVVVVVATADAVAVTALNDEEVDVVCTASFGSLVEGRGRVKGLDFRVVAVTAVVGRVGVEPRCVQDCSWIHRHSPLASHSAGLWNASQGPNVSVVVVVVDVNVVGVVVSVVVVAVDGAVAVDNGAVLCAAVVVVVLHCSQRTGHFASSCVEIARRE